MGYTTNVKRCAEHGAPHKVLKALEKARVEGRQGLALSELTKCFAQNAAPSWGRVRTVLEDMAQHDLIEISHGMATIKPHGRSELERIKRAKAEKWQELYGPEGQEARAKKLAEQNAAEKANVVPPRTIDHIHTTCPPDKPVTMRPGAADFMGLPSRRGNLLVYPNGHTEPATHAIQPRRSIP